MSELTRQIVEAFGQDACFEGVDRRGNFETCDLPAVAIRLDPEEQTPYPVCKNHTRGAMVSLHAIVVALEAEEGDRG